MTVMLVDDLSKLPNSFAMELKRIGFTTRAAASAKEGLALLNSHPLPDLIVVDRRTITSDGELFYFELLKNPQFSAIPLAMVGGDTLDLKIRIDNIVEQTPAGDAVLAAVASLTKLQGAGTV